MATKSITVKVCDRCGERTYDIYPRDWLSIDHVGDLCGKCAKEFKVLVTGFFGENTPKNWRA